jgi:hypothetical protein
VFDRPVDCELVHPGRQPRLGKQVPRDFAFCFFYRLVVEVTCLRRGPGAVGADLNEIEPLGDGAAGSWPSVISWVTAVSSRNGRLYLAPPKEGSRRDVDIPRWLVRPAAAAHSPGPAMPVPAPRRRHQRVRLARAVRVPGAGGRARTAVELRLPGLPARRRRRLPGRETPPRLPHRPLAGALLARAVPWHPGAGGRHPPGEGRAAGGMLLGAAGHGADAARAAAWSPDGDAARPGAPGAAARPPRSRPLRRHRRPLHPHRRRDDRGHAGLPDAPMASSDHETPASYLLVRSWPRSTAWPT